MSVIELHDLAAGLARNPIARLDPLLFLGETSSEIARCLNIAGVVVAVPATSWVRGSDEALTLLGETQHRDGRGPLSAVLRSAHPIVTPDLTRIGPPSLAALASEVGFLSSAAVAVRVGGGIVAAVQLVGRTGQPVKDRHVEALVPVLETFGARIMDLIEISRLRRLRPASSDLSRQVSAASDVRTTAHPVVPPQQAPAHPSLSGAVPELVTQELRVTEADVVPLPRREPGLPAERPRSRRVHREE